MVQKRNRSSTACAYSNEPAEICVYAEWEQGDGKSSDYLVDVVKPMIYTDSISSSIFLIVLVRRMEVSTGRNWWNSIQEIHWKGGYPMAESADLHFNLKKVRTEKGLTQNDVAKKLGISRQAVSRWENGAAYPDIDNLTLLSEIYGISVDELLGTKPADSGTGQKEPLWKTKEPFSLKDLLSNREHWILILILVLTSYQAVIGFTVSCYILVWTLIKRRNYKFVIVLSAICVLYHLNSLLIYISLYIPGISSGTIEEVL